ncbi:MAG: undecaprenyl diphosphate synthase family protein, partial [Spirochaetaceae bacterium]|jgi:undecaprenyl diphosphate synthase|nr:undecaprenyl diphosphate synthase family protein [Spirochaetaceae bacterium]
MQVILALNYGGRDEIVRGMRKLFARVKDGAFDAGAITEKTFAQYLDNPDVPDPDLIIRTGGEWRTSNFLLWEGAYAEYYVSEKLWPDWTGKDLEMAIATYARRERRYGGVTA